MPQHREWKRVKTYNTEILDCVKKTTLPDCQLGYKSSSNKTLASGMYSRALASPVDLTIILSLRVSSYPII